MADLEKSPFVSWPRPEPNASTPPLDIAAFLRARLDEREEANRDPEHVDSVHAYSCDLFEELGEKCDCGEPAFVLADVAAKRMILDAHESLWTTGPLPLRSAPACKTCSSEVEGWPCTTLRLLALPYAGHPDYREEWKP